MFDILKEERSWERLLLLWLLLDDYFKEKENDDEW